MKNDEKKCPLTKMTCYGEECGWWRESECAVKSLACAARVNADETYTIRRILGDPSR